MGIEAGVKQISLKENLIYDISPTNVEQVKFDSDLDNLIKDIAKKEDFLTYEIERKILCNLGGNYLGVLFEVDIKGTTLKGRTEINLFLKKILKDDKLTILSISDAYKKEIYVYKELSKIYEELQKSANVPKDEMFKMVKCYGVLNKSLSETIILENLTKQGYITCDRLKCICPTYADLAVKDLAKFHALGFVMKKRQPDYFKNNFTKLNKPFNLDDKWAEFVKTITGSTLNKIDCKITKGKLEKFIDNKLLKEYDSYFDPNKYSTLCHGDFRANNVMVKVMNGKYTNTMVLDYQLIYYGNPINDLIYFIFGATDQIFRKEHLERLKNVYFDAMKSFLNYFDVNVEDVYPRAVFEKDYKEKLDIGLMFALQILPFILINEEDVPDLSEVDMASIKLSDKDDSLFKERILGIIDDYVTWGYI